MCSCHSILECCVMFSLVKLSMGSFVLFIRVCFIQNRKIYENSTKDFCSTVDQTPILSGGHPAFPIL